MIWGEPLVLQGDVVRLEPLRPDHASALYAVGQDPVIWRYLPTVQPTSLHEMELWVEKALARQAAGNELVFATIALASGRVVGSTRYLDISAQNRGLEIGWTWLGREARRTAINTECKYLLLRYAFETLGAIRVQLKTDSRNTMSQQAIERLGAVKEGVLRNHVIMPDGYFRHSVYYSILDSEWASVKQRLETFLHAKS